MINAASCSCLGASARSAEGPASGVKRELLGQALGGPRLAFGTIGRGHPISQSTRMVAIAERGQATHAQPERYDRDQGSWNQDEQHNEVRLGDCAVARATASCGPLPSNAAGGGPQARSSAT